MSLETPDAPAVLTPENRARPEDPVASRAAESTADPTDRIDAGAAPGARSGPLRTAGNVIFALGFAVAGGVLALYVNGRPQPVDQFCADAPQLDASAATELLDSYTRTKPSLRDYTTFTEGANAYVAPPTVGQPYSNAAAALTAAYRDILATETAKAVTSEEAIALMGRLIDADTTFRWVCQARNR